LKKSNSVSADILGLSAKSQHYLNLVSRVMEKKVNKYIGGKMISLRFQGSQIHSAELIHIGNSPVKSKIKLT